jgi:hypothetical protein
MKCFTVILIAAIALAGLLTGCSTSPQARIVRLKLDSVLNHWHYSLNGGKTTFFSSDSLTNQLSHLRLRHGDMILFGMVPIRSGGITSTTWNWLSHYCDSNRVATFYYIDSSEGDIFSVSAYLWVAPFDNPRTLAHASFFYEGKFLGYRMNGYQNMLRRIKRTCPHQIFILGSLYDLNQNFGPNEAPYEDEEQLLDDVVTKCGTELLLPHPLLGF